jgi:hypothetical protein
MACRIQHTREWAVRLVHELDSYDAASFTTLTYDDEHIPKAGSLVKRDLQLFFKRLRKAGREFRYYACGEYGGKFQRPHYHIIFFGQSFMKKDDPLLREVWPYGFNYSGTVTYDSCRYVAGYCIDKLSGPLADAAYASNERPFQLQSKGLGRDWCDKNADQIKSGKEFTSLGRPIGLPAYYKRRLDYKNTSVAAERSLSHYKDLSDHLESIDLVEMALRRTEARRIEVLSRDQDALNIEARQHLYGRE